MKRKLISTQRADLMIIQIVRRDGNGAAEDVHCTGREI